VPAAVFRAPAMVDLARLAARVGQREGTHTDAAVTGACVARGDAVRLVLGRLSIAGSVVLDGRAERTIRGRTHITVGCTATVVSSSFARPAGALTVFSVELHIAERLGDR